MKDDKQIHYLMNYIFNRNITTIMYVQCRTEKHILNMASKSIAKNIYNLRSVKKNEKYFCEVDRTYAQIEN